jgi:hypothetical protein
MKANASTPHREAAADPKEFTVYAELLAKAHDEGLKSIQTQILAQPNDENGRRCIVKATVETEKGKFEGLGDADPSNVEPFLVPHLIRVAETRAKARALRDAVNCGIVSFEELDGVRPSRDDSPGPGATSPRSPRHVRNGSAAVPRPAGSARSDDGQDGPMSEAQRRYLFRILAGHGYQGQAAEDYLHAEFEVRALSQVTRRQASEMIDALLSAAPGTGGGGNGAGARSQR